MELFFRLHLHYGDVKLLEVDFEELVLTQHFLSELSLVLSRVCPLDVVLEDDFELFLFVLVHEAEAEEVDVCLGLDHHGIPVGVTHVEVVSFLEFGEAFPLLSLEGP